jgi:hypothetical protein
VPSPDGTRNNRPATAKITSGQVGNHPAAEVHVVGVYQGTYPPDVRGGDGTHSGAVTINVPKGKKPVILVLSSYEPVIWRIEAPQDTIAHVIASGYFRQTVEGLDEKVPFTLISHEAGDKNFFYAHRREAEPSENDYERGETQRKYDQLVEQVRALTKKDIKNFQGAYTGSTFEIR